MVRLALGVTAVVLLAGTAVAAPAINLASHRAIYDLSLDQSGDGADVSSISGRMVMEFTGSACAGYKTRLRFVTQTQDPDGNQQVIDSRSDLFEGKDGQSLEFSNQTFTDQAISEESSGLARRAGKNIAISLKKPASKKFDVGSGTLFPTEQMETIIDAARSGQKFVTLDLYDGSEDGQTVFTTAGVIGDEVTANEDAGDEAVMKDAGMGGLRHWPVTISYFKNGPGDQTPYYVMSFVIYENGIGRSLKINYGDFALTGKLTQLDTLPVAPCH